MTTSHKRKYAKCTAHSEIALHGRGLGDFDPGHPIWFLNPARSDITVQRLELNQVLLGVAPQADEYMHMLI